jgi:hypothetical protein
MAADWQGATKLETVQRAAMSLLALIQQEGRSAGGSHELGVVTFATTAQLDLPLTADYAQAGRIIQNLVPGGQTDMGAGLQAAHAALQGAADAKKTIILISGSQPNAGLSPAEILSGLLRDAVGAGICIYTVGLGGASDLDEDLLQRLARDTCGEYTPVRSPSGLETAYTWVRHGSAGTILAEFSGTVAQDEVTAPRTILVPADQHALHLTLNWAGGRLDPLLTDPLGNQVSIAYPGVAYPGATQATYARMANLILREPLEGTWQLAIQGTYVPEDAVDYQAVVSARPRAVPATLPAPSPEDVAPAGPVQELAPAPEPEVAGATPADLVVAAAIGLLLGVALLALIVLFTRRRSPATWAGIAVTSDPSRWANLRRDVLYIGRDPRCELALADVHVSRVHARILRTPYGCLVEDLGSANGTWVNGQPIGRQHLLPGDRIDVGRTRLTYFERRRR